MSALSSRWDLQLELSPSEPGPLLRAALSAALLADGADVPVTAAFDESKIKRDNEGQFAEKAGGLADVLDDVNVDGLDGQTVYVGIREDGTVDLGVGAGDDDPVARFSRHDVTAISDEAYRLWRLRDDNPADAAEVFGQIDDAIVDIDGQRIYLAISQGQTYTADPEDPDDEDGYGPILTVGIPTANDTEDVPDFHEVQLDEDGFDNFIGSLEAFRDNYEQTDVETVSLNGDYDISLMNDHTIQVSSGGDDRVEMSIFEASSLAEAIERLQGVETPAEGTYDPDNPDTVDGEDVSDDVGVSLNEDGTLTLNLTTGSRRGEYVTVEPDDIPALVETLRDFTDKDHVLPGGAGAANPVTAAGTGGRNHMVQPVQPGTVMPVDPEPDDPPLTAAADVHTGAMIALIPSTAAIERLTVEGGEPPGELHCALLYLGEAADIPPEVQAAISDALREVAAAWPVVEADGFAVNLFNPGPGDPEPCVVLGLSGEDLDIAHGLVVDAVEDVCDEHDDSPEDDVDGGGWEPAEQHTPWHAHLTLQYFPADTDPAVLALAVAGLVDRVGPVTFDRLRVAYAGVITDFPLAVREPTPDADGDFVAGADDCGCDFEGRMPPQLRKFWAKRLALGSKGSFKKCVRAMRRHFPKDPEGTCANLYKSVTGQWPGCKKTSHGVAGDEETTMTTTTATADTDLADKAMPVPEVIAADGDCPEGQHRDEESGDCVPDEAEADYAAHADCPDDGDFCRNPLHPGPCKGHKQKGSSGAAKPAAKKAATGGPGSASLLSEKKLRGLSDERIEQGIIMYGNRSPAGKQLQDEQNRRKKERAVADAEHTANGLDSVNDEFDASSAEPTIDVDALAAQDGEHFRTSVREGQSTGFRSFAANSIEWREPPFAFHEQIDSSAHGGTARTVQRGIITRAERDGDTVHFYGRLDLRSPDTVDYARRLAEGFAVWSSVGPDESVRGKAIEFVWPEQADGQGGELADMLMGEPDEMIFHSYTVAEISAVSVPALADARVEATPALLDELAALGVLTTPEPSDEPIVAGGYIIEIPDCPPAAWFAEPTDVTAHGALTVTDEGRIYGYLAPNGVAHRSFPGQRVTVPMGRVDYERWMGGEAIVADGTRVVAGPITMECGHLPPSAASESVIRMEHYDNACSVVAKARIGENRHGVWIAGALEPGVTADQVSRMLACRLSGDWAPHPERPGWREFVAALVVPVPGFPQARTAPSVRVADGALVASAVPVRVVHAGDDATEVDDPGCDLNLRPVLERIAAGIGRDAGSRRAATRAQFAELRDRVHAGSEV